MDPMTLWVIAVMLLLILIGRSIPFITEEIQLDQAKRRAKLDDPIDWSPDHNLKVPMSPYFDPRVEFTEEEAFIDLIEENARLVREVEEAHALEVELEERAEEVRKLEEELEHQLELKKRYLKELHRAKR